MPQTSQDRRVAYLPLSSLQPDPRNPKAHRNDVMGDSIGRFGMVDPIVQDGRTGLIVSGHGRRETLLQMYKAGQAPPEGVQLDEDSGEWLVPVLVGWSSRSDLESGAALIALNRVGEIGGWQDESLLELLADLNDIPDGLDGIGFGESDLEGLRHVLDSGPPSLDDLAEEVGEPTEEDLLVKVVFTFTREQAAIVNRVLATHPDSKEAMLLEWVEAADGG